MKDMTPAEALHVIEIAQAEVEWEYPLDYAIAFDEAIVALRKQIPQPTTTSDDGFALCPTCGTRALWDGFENENYCCECGQKLRWR